jgi:hypothetical protein
MFSPTTSPIGAAPAAITPAITKHHARVLDQRLVDFDAELLAHFYHSDFQVVAEFAVKSGVAVFICSAALSLKKREEIAAEWRAAQIISAASIIEPLAEWLGTLPAEDREEIKSGKIVLAELDRRLSDWMEHESSRLSGLRAESKNRLRAVIAETLVDADSEADREHNITPAAVVICENGAMGIFRRRGAAVEFGRASQGRFLLAEIDRGTVRFEPAPDDALLRKAPAENTPVASIG